MDDLRAFFFSLFFFFASLGSRFGKTWDGLQKRAFVDGKRTDLGAHIDFDFSLSRSYTYLVTIIPLIPPFPSVAHVPTLSLRRAFDEEPFSFHVCTHTQEEEAESGSVLYETPHEDLFSGWYPRTIEDTPRFRLYV